MSSRHTPRQSERDLRVHDSRPPPNHVHPHLNGTSQPPLNTSSIPPQPRSHASPAVSANGAAPISNVQKLAQANEQTWLLIGSDISLIPSDGSSLHHQTGRVAEQMGNVEHALSAYENALRHNPNSLPGLIQVAGIARIKEDYQKAIDYFQRVVELQNDNGEVWSSLGHCYLMRDDLQRAYSAYQQALYLLPSPKDDPKLWYGIGILYDRYGSLDHAEEAFASVLRMNKDLDFDKSNEILFRLGIIYKQRSKYKESLSCFEKILQSPPNPLAHADIWFQIGHVHEQQNDLVNAKMAYERVVADNPNHAKVLQQLGWLYHQDGSTFQNQETAVTYLTRSLEADPHDAQSWYLLGRAYMAGQKYNKAYEAYQQAVYRDGRNPTFWCSIGVLDALDAYSRAIRINPYISEVWFDLGSLYESCNNQISDAIDAYARAAELDPRNTAITQRLELLKQAQATGAQLPAAPGPQDVHPTAYANTVVQPPGLTGPPLLLQGSNANRVPPRGDLRNGDSSLPLPPPPNTVGPGRPTSPRPFRGGPPPPVIVDESRHNQSRLAPMDIDRPPAHNRDPPSLYPSSRGPSTNRHSSILLHQPVPQPPPSDGRNGHPHGHDPHFPSRQIRPPSTSTSPVPRGHTPRTSSYSNHPSQRPPPPGLSHPPRSPRPYPAEVADRDSRRDDRDWDRERRGRHLQEYPAPPPHQMFATRAHSPPYRGHSPGPRSARDYSPPQPSPRNAHQSVPGRSYPSPWTESKPAAPRSPPTQPLPEPHPSRRYDPRNDGRDPRELRDYDPMDTRPDLRSRPPSHHGSPESVRNTLRQPPPLPPTYPKRSPSPHLPSHAGMQMSENRGPTRRRGSQREKELEPHYSPGSADAKRDRKRKNLTGTPTTGIKRRDEDIMYVDRPPNNGQPSFRVNTYPTRGGSAVRSVHQSPTAAPVPPKRYGVAEVLMDLASYRTHVPSSQPLPPPPVQGPSGRASPRPMNSHRGSISSNRGDRDSPALSTGSNQKRPLSPTSEDNGSGDLKRPKVDGPKLSPTPSPIPFRTQPTSSSPEVRQQASPPPLPAVLPPHPRPIGNGMALPPIATISPTSSVSPGRDEDRMAVDRPRSTTPPPSRAKISEVMNRPNKSPTPTPMDREHAH
ncbi:TPR-like protein [Thelephora ganbajun]|uniref:TPR-like protein n=1 Tax=Thelephora ganbajun TaxID=370292 RepID=A0ACB6ZR54_THEGA|nr:TPR-like protein [Thelephora ganbajun]